MLGAPVAPVVSDAFDQHLFNKAPFGRLNPPPARTDICGAWSRKLPGLSKSLCDQANLKPTGARTIQNRNIHKREINGTHSKVRVLVVGAMHGDELSSVTLALNWIALASENSANVHWQFLPMLNPDGVFSSPSKRTNAHGVDLNRNFPTPNWREEATFYWEKRTKRDPRRWPGPQPLSEPESQFLHEEMQRFKPHLIVSIHAPYGLLDYDGPSSPPPKLGRLYLDQVGIFPGSLGNYGGIQQGMPVVTIELPSANAVPNAAETRQMWIDLLRWMSERIKP